MRTLEAPAIILDTFNLQERDRVVGFLTAEWGKKRGVARGARAKYSRFAGQLQPLARVRMSWFEKEGRDLVRINDVALSRPAAALQEDLEGILLGSYLAEHMAEFAQENESSEKLFRLLDTTIEALIGGADRALAARYFEVWMLRLSGIFPAPRECPHCGREIADAAVVLPGDGELVCTDCVYSDAHGGHEAQGLTVGAGELDFLRRTRHENLAQLARRPPAAAALGRVERVCAQVRRAFLQYELKSYRVMQRTLAGI